MLENDVPGLTSLGGPEVRTSPPMQGLWVRSVVGELRSCKPHSQNTKT